MACFPHVSSFSATAGAVIGFAFRMYANGLQKMPLLSRESAVSFSNSVSAAGPWGHLFAAGIGATLIPAAIEWDKAQKKSLHWPKL